MDKEKLKARLDSINIAISNNIQSVKFEHKEIVYRSLADMIKARDIIQKQLNDGRVKKTRKTAVYSRGL